jgi:iron complex outermembrane receptor protein
MTVEKFEADKLRHEASGRLARPGIAALAVLSAAMMLSGAASFAQTAPPTSQQGAGKLEEVVVTAQKRSERLHNVPISVAVLGGKELQKQNIYNIDDLGVKIPNVEMVLPFGPEEPQFSIRGVTETDFQPSQSSPVALYVDGTYKSVGALTAMALFDVDQIEVLRGPQGTLQGRNATGGAVNINSVKPNLDTYTGFITAGVGNFGRYETQGAVNFPIVNDKLAVRAAWSYTNVDGYIKNVEPNAPFGGNLAGVDDFGGRLSVLFKPTDNLSAILRVNYFYSDPVNYGVYAKDIPSQGIGIPYGSLAYTGIPSNLYGPSGYTRAGLGFFDSSSEDVHRRLMTNHSINFEVNYNITDALKLTSITGYDQGKWTTPEDDDGTLINNDEAQYLSTVHSTQEEVRLTSSFDGPDNFIFGVLYDAESLFQKVHTTWAGYQPAIVTEPGTDTTYNICLITGFWTCDLRTQFSQYRADRAAYIHNTFKITDDLTLELGARYTDDLVTVNHYEGGVSWLNPNGTYVPEIYFVPGPLDAPNPALPLGGGTLNPGSGAPRETQTDHKWSGKAGFTYKITPNNMVYASWSLGFRGSAYNGAATFGTNTINAVQPETLYDYEIGSKNQFLNDRLQLDFGGFYYIYRNQQFATLNELTGLSEEYNLPKINSEGLEFDLLGRPIPDVTLHLGGGYTYAVYRAGENAGINVAGNTVEETPKWSFVTAVDWKILQNDQGTLSFHGDGNIVTKQFYDALNSVPAEQNGYTLWNMRLTGESPSGRESVSLWVQNLFDRHYFTSIFNTDASLNFSYAQRGLPRTFGAQATYRF